MSENAREDRFRRRARLARPFLISFLVCFAIAGLIRQLVPSNGLSAVLSAIFGIMALISAMLGMSALEIKYKPPPDLAVRINELSDNLTRSSALSPKSVPRCSFKRPHSKGFRPRLSKTATLHHYIRMKPTPSGGSLRTPTRKVLRLPIANSGSSFWAASPLV